MNSLKNLAERINDKMGAWSAALARCSTFA